MLIPMMAGIATPSQVPRVHTASEAQQLALTSSANNRAMPDQPMPVPKEIRSVGEYSTTPKTEAWFTMMNDEAEACA